MRRCLLLHSAGKVALPIIVPPHTHTLDPQLPELPDKSIKACSSVLRDTLFLITQLLSAPATAVTPVLHEVILSFESYKANPTEFSLATTSLMRAP